MKRKVILSKLQSLHSHLSVADSRLAYILIQGEI